MFLTLRLFIALCTVLMLPITHAAADAAASMDPFDVTPCVWRTFDSTSFYEIQQRLRRDVIGSPECHPHNRAVATLMILGEDGSVSPIDLVCRGVRVFQSNYVYPLNDEAIGYDKSRIEGEFKVARKEFTTSAGAIGATDDAATLTRLFSENRQKLVVLERHTSALESMRVLEADYNAFYPFHDSNYRSRLLDAESSICMLIENKLRSRVIDLSSARSISLHMHSDNNLCFYCVQLLNSCVKKWAGDTGKPWKVLVSSHKEYVWKGVLPSGHIVPVDTALAKPTMRLYGRDEHYDAVLLDAELESFTYLPGRPGKIIQTFLPMVDETAPAATAAASE